MKTTKLISPRRAAETRVGDGTETKTKTGSDCRAMQSFEINTSTARGVFAKGRAWGNVK
jgi:hypothetical protein